MKSLITILATLFSVSAFAAEPALICERGEMGNDNYLEVRITPTKIAFTQHESHYEVKRSQVNNDGHSYSILQKAVTAQVEGTKAKLTVDSLIVYHPAAKSITLTLMIDGFPSVAGELLECHN